MKKFFGESVSYPADNEIEKKEAKLYLELWKKFLIRRLKKDSFDVTFIDEQWIHRDASFSGCLAQNESLALKICLEMELKYDLEKIWM